jgi:hypothetical protein
MLWRSPVHGGKYRANRFTSEVSPETKRWFLNVVIEEIRCSVKRGEKKGENACKLRGDGTVKKTWEVAKQNEEPATSLSGGSTPRVVRLRERLENSNYVLLRIPIEIHNLEHGQRLICLDSDRLPQELDLNEDAIGSLVQAGLVRLRQRSHDPRNGLITKHSNRPTPGCLPTGVSPPKLISPVTWESAESGSTGC